MSEPSYTLSLTQKFKQSSTFTVQPRNRTTHSSTVKSYDWTSLREKLREEDVRPLSKHCLFRPIEHAHNARVDVSTIN